MRTGTVLVALAILVCAVTADGGEPGTARVGVGPGASPSSGDGTTPVSTVEPLRLVRIPTDHPEQLASRLRPLGFDLDHAHTYPRGLEIVVSAAEQAWLVAHGHEIETVRVGRPLRETLPEGIPDGYGDIDWIYDQMHAAAARRPDICEVVDLTARYGTPPTFEGRHLYAVRISDNIGVDEPEPAVLIVAAHHAREIGTPIVALRTIDNLVDGHGSDARITAAVDDHEIWIAPVWNPDGYTYVYNVDDFWRKNRRLVPRPPFVGTYGVDLNRNYPLGWGTCGGSSSPTSSVYSGPAPASESETQTMLAFADDRRFARVADLHSFASEVRHSYGCWTHPWEPSFYAIAQHLAAFSGYVPAPSCCLGGNFEMHTNQYGALSFLWEIGTRFHPSFESASAEADAVWHAMIDLIDRGSAVSGRVTRLGTGQPIEAEITLVGAGFIRGERHRSAPRHGLFHAHPPFGTWTLRFEADGFETEERTVTLNSASPTAVIDVGLRIACAADLAQPWGVLDLADITAFLQAFAASDPNADLAEPFGVFDLADIVTFVTAFDAGCP